MGDWYLGVALVGVKKSCKINQLFIIVCLQIIEIKLVASRNTKFIFIESMPADWKTRN